MKRSRLVIGGVIFLAAGLGGVWYWASAYASRVAEDMLDEAIRGHGLRPFVSYDRVSASPFGRVTINDIRIEAPVARITIDQAIVTDIVTRHDQVTGLSVTLKKIEVPLLKLAQGSPLSADQAVQAMVGLGYQSTTADLSFSLHRDDTAERVTLTTQGTAADLGSWSAELSVQGLSETLLGSIGDTASAASSASLLQSLAKLQSVKGELGRLELSHLALSLDDRPLLARARMRPLTAVPAAAGDATSRIQVETQAALTDAGLKSSEARDAAAVWTRFITDGARIRLETANAHPIPLFVEKPGIFGSDLVSAIRSMPDFVVKTRASITD